MMVGYGVKATPKMLDVRTCTIEKLRFNIKQVYLHITEISAFQVLFISCKQML